MCRHRSNINNNRTIYICVHFNFPDHNIRNLSVQAIDTDSDTTELKLQTYTPKGLNASSIITHIVLIIIYVTHAVITLSCDHRLIKKRRVPHKGGGPVSGIPYPRGGFTHTHTHTHTHTTINLALQNKLSSMFTCAACKIKMSDKHPQRLQFFAVTLGTM